MTRQVGEHLVVAELGRRGYVATAFSGNIPMFDILAADPQGRAVPIQVKAINGPSWQFNASTFLTVEIVKNEQIVRGRAALPHPDLLCIFVFLKKAGEDGRRPKNPQSMHCAIWPKELARFRDNWKLIDAILGATRRGGRLAHSRLARR